MPATTSSHPDLEPRSFPARLAEIAFSVGLPHGFAVLDVPLENLEFEKPTFMAPLMVASSEVALAVLTVAARPAYEDGSVMQWLQFFTSDTTITGHAMDLKSLMPGRIGAKGKEHPAILATAEQVQDGTRLRLHIAMLEDGGRLVIVMAMVPEELWPSFGEQLAAAVESFALDAPKGPTMPLIPGAPAPKLGH